MKIEDVPMVRVTWMDARDMENGWLSEKDILAAPLAKCQDVGWMVVNNDDRIVINRSWCHEEDSNEGGGATAIPKCCVKKIEYLEVSNAARWKFTGNYENI
jgi:hypothetical protein